MVRQYLSLHVQGQELFIDTILTIIHNHIKSGNLKLEDIMKNRFFIMFFSLCLVISLYGCSSHDEASKNIPEGYITFGTFEQDGNESNGTEPIEWMVLKKENRKMLIISKYVLDEQVFTAEPYCVWEDSDIRTYLNGSFYENAFSPAEKERILTSRVTNETITANTKKTKFADPGSVEDKVFLLSVKEYTEYFPIQGWSVNGLYASSYMGRCSAVPACNADVRPFHEDEYEKFYSDIYPQSVLDETSCAWFTRTVSPEGTEGLTGASVWAIDWSGSTHPYIFRADFGIRPAMWISEQ